jgi:hypothetical protein
MWFYSSVSGGHYRAIIHQGSSMNNARFEVLTAVWIFLRALLGSPNCQHLFWRNYAKLEILGCKTNYGRIQILKYSVSVYTHFLYGITSNDINFICISLFLKIQLDMNNSAPPPPFPKKKNIYIYIYTHTKLRTGSSDSGVLMFLTATHHFVF